MRIETLFVFDDFNDVQHKKSIFKPFSYQKA